MTRAWVGLVVLLACGGDDAPSGGAVDAGQAGQDVSQDGGTALGDVAPAPDVQGGTDGGGSPGDTSLEDAPDGAAGDAGGGTDGGGGGGADTGGLDAADAVELPVTPERVAIGIDWALQSTPGSNGVLASTSLSLADGDLLVGGAFAGEVTVGDVTVSTDDVTYLHHMAVRVRPDGTLRFARHVCDGCLGVAAEASDGRIGVAASGKALVGNPGTPDVIDRSEETVGAAFTVMSPEGLVLDMRRFAEGPALEVRAVLPLDDGGWLIGGHLAQQATFKDGTVIDVPAEVFYPGRGFIARLRPDLSVQWVEPIAGTAASSVNMLASHGAGFVAVGDFGGYPLGVEAVFGGEAGPTLEAKSSDDDPAMDLFVAAWAGPGDVTLARRVQHYGWLRAPTWLNLDAGGVTVGLEGAVEFVVEDGELSCGYGGDGTLDVRFSWGGAFLGAKTLPPRARPWPGGGWWSNTQTWAGGTWTLGEPPASLTFDAPPQTDDADSTSWVLARWTPGGQLVRAGQLVAWHTKWMTSPFLAGASPQPDGSWLLALNGHASLTLDAPTPIVLDNTGYERFVFLRVRFEEP
ncbi:MAG: hypothetical protein AMXMBFR64_22840 [Myxococcales bacterium]